MPAELSGAPEIAIIGGGTGSNTLLNELKNFTPYITGIANMSDSGGSSGILRDELGVLPPGDFLNALLGLSNSLALRRILAHRFKIGRNQGDTVGNLFISGAEEEYGTLNAAVKPINESLNITGKSVPVTLDKTNAVLTTTDGEIVGEHLISDATILDPDAIISHRPAAGISKFAKRAIAKADIVVIAPGNVFSSLLPSLAVRGMREAISSRKGKLVAVSNLVTKPKQTDGWHVVDYVKKYERYLGEGAIEYVLYNNEPPSKELLEKYAADGEYPVDFSEERFLEISARAIGDAFVAGTIYTQDPSDKIRRTLIRHDARKVGRRVMSIFYE